MNKIFKVVWSKTKECYVVVSEVAKNNGGKKKALSTVFAALVAAGAMIPGQVDAAAGYGAAGGTASGNDSVAIGTSAEATHNNAVAIGRLSKAKDTSATAVGVNNQALALDSSAVGSSNTIAATATEASAFGRENTVNYGSSIAAGYKNIVNGGRSVAVGNENTTAGEETIGIGTKVIAGTGKTIAIGNIYNPKAKPGQPPEPDKQTIARGDDSINPATGQVSNIFALAIGNGAQADGKIKHASGMIAIGQDVLADNNNTIAIGVQTQATGNNSTAIGGSSLAKGVSSAAFGTQAVANGTGATAFGPGSSAGTGAISADGSVAVGRKATVTAAGGVGIGWASAASEKNATAIGFSATASGVQSVAIGGGDEYDYPGTERGKNFTTASGKSSVAVGSYAKATAENAMAFGKDANANIEGGVALGSESKTTVAAGITGYNPADSRTNKYSTQAGAVGTSTLAAVSIGDGSNKTRQLTGLAAGTADTDAVNVAQLKNVNLKYAADTGNSDVLLKDGTLTVKGDGDLISTDAQTNGVIKVTAKKGGTITNTDGKAVKPTTNGIATTDNVADAINNSYWKATAGGNTDGTPAVGNVKPGNQVTYSAGDNLKVKQTINNSTGDQEYKYSLNPVLTGITSIANTATGPKMTFGGSSINITGGSLDMGNNKITSLATGTADTDAVNVKQLKDTELHITPGTYTPDANKKVKLTYTDGNNTVVTGKEAVIDLSSLATGGTASTESVVKKAAATGDTNIADVSVAGGKAVNDPGAQYEVSVSKNAVKDAAREAVTVNNGGNTDNPISVTPTQDNANHNTTYAVTFDGNKAAKQIPLTYKANGTGDKTVKLDKGLDFTNGTNTTAEIGNDGVVKFNLNKDVDLSNTGSLTVGDTKVTNGGVTITAPAGGTTSNVTLTQSGLDNGGNKIVNVADGDVNATSKDAINGSQLYTVNQKFNNKINLGADGNTETTKLALDNASGIKFNIKGDGSGASGANQYISTTASGSDIKVDLTQAAKDKLNKTYNVTSTNHSVAINTTTANGVTTFDLQVAPATGTTSTWDIKSSADTANGGATATGHETTAKTIANTNSVEMIAGKNLTVKQTSDTNGAKVEFALSDEIAVGKDGANGIDGKIGVNGKDGASVVINGKDGSIGLTGVPGTPGTPGASATLKVKDGVPGVDGAPGTNLTRIVYTDKNNVEHEVATHDDGMKFAGDDGQTNQATNTNVIKKHLNSVVDIIGGATKADLTTNNIGVNNDGNKLLVQLSKNLNGINTIKNGGTTITLNDAPGGATNTPAVTISGGNLSMGDGTHNNKIVNVAPGTDDNDAVNYKQLKAAKTEVKAGDNVTVKLTTDTTDGHNVYTVSAVTPAVYTKADGTKVYKIVDPTSGAVTWNTSPDGTGTVVNAGDVITSFESPANGSTPGSTTGGTMIVNNVGSAINGKTGATYLDKLDAAAGDNNTKHAAVNVTDLKSTADALTDKGLKFDANVGGVKTNKLGSTVKVQGAGASADADYSGANIKTFIDQDATGNTTIDVKLDKNLAGINSITGDTNSGKLVFQNPTASGNNGDAFKFTGGNINAGGNNITNLKSGIVNNNATDDTNGANIGDVKKIAKDSDLHIAPTAGTTNNVAEYTVDANNKVTLTYQDGNGTAVAAPKAVIDLSALANKITSGYTFNANAIANGGTVANDATTPAAVTAVANGGTINYAAGKNLTVKQDIDATAKTHTYTYSLDKDLTNLDKVVVNGKDGISGKDGVTIIGPQGATGATGIPGTNGIDGKVGIAGKDGKDAVSISGKDGVGHIGLQGPKGAPGTPGADGANLDITTDHGTQTLTKPEANNGGKSERIVYVPKDANGNPLKDTDGNTIKREVATMDDGLKFTGNNESTENKHKLGSLVKVQGEGVTENITTNKLEANGEEFKSASGNIAVVADSIDKLTVKLNKNLAGINKISNGGSSITLNDTPNATTPAVTISGGNLSMGNGTTNNKIVNVAPGTDDSDAVNYKQLKAAKTEVKAGKNVVVTSDASATDGHTTYTVNASTSAIYTKPDGTKLVKQPDGTFKDENGNAYTGPVIASFEDNNGSTTGGNMIVNNVGSAIKNLGSAGDNYLTKLDLANTATPNAAVNVSDLKNTADALQANERHIAPTTVATGSTENKGGTASGGTNVYKYDATNKTVTLTYNDGKGNAVTDTKAVIDFSTLNTGAGASSWNIASDKVSATEGAVAAGSAGTQNIADGKTVTMKAGKNLTVNQANDGAGNASVAFSLDKNLENLDKVVVNGNDGTTGKAGVSIVGPKGANGVDGNDGKVGIAGKDGKDAVSISGKDGVGHIGLQGPKGAPGTPGADGANLDITTDHGTQTLVKPEANNDNKSERIVYVPKDANGNPLKDTDGNTIKREVATMDDGLKFTGNNTGTVNKHKLGSLVKVQGEGVSATDEAAFVSASGNIAVTAENNDTLTIRLNKNLKGLNSIQLGDNTIKSNGDNIEFTTKGGTTKTVATTDQLWTIQAEGTDVPATNGKVNVVGKDGITVAKNAAGNLEISGAGLGKMNSFDVTANNGATSKTIDNGKKVDFNAGSNLTVKQTNDANGTHIEYALKEAVDLGTNGSLKIGNTTINNDGFKNGNTTVGGNGMTINNPADPAKTVSLTKDGLNNGGNQITNVASGGDTDTNGANIGDVKRIAKAGDTRVKEGTYAVDNNGTVELTYVDGAGKQVTDAAGNPLKAKITGITTLDSTRVNVAVNKTGTGEVTGSTAPVKVTKGTEFVAGNNLIVERTAHTGNDLDNSVVYSLNSNLTGITSISNTATGPKMTFGGNNVNLTGGDVKISNGNLDMNHNKITNVDKGTDSKDAANVGQLTQVKPGNSSVTVGHTVDPNTGANIYTITANPAGTVDLTNVNNRVDQLGEEIGRVGAQGAALSALKPIQYDPLEPTQIMAGYGNYRGTSAIAMGVAHYKNESTLIHGGISWAGGSSHMMANAGVTWKVGNRDSEAAVADRYRKGPISSAYAMQQEMAAMKAQNAGLKGEVSDLKAENEQMKAQIAAMMAKLGL